MPRGQGRKRLHAHNPEGPNPEGLCLCGCGEKTRIAPVTKTEYGIVAGFPMRYVKGHHPRKPMTWTVDPETGCWNWDGYVSKRGRPKVMDNGRQVFAHRWVYEQRVGSIAEGVRLHHECENWRCVNPDHLEPMTQSEHMALHWQKWKAEAA